MVESLVSTVVEKLGTTIPGQVALFVDVTSDIDNLSSAFTSIRAVLEDAESRRVNDRLVRIWLEKVKDVAYDVDDILDEWWTEAHRQAPDEGDGSCFSFLVTCFLSYVTLFNHFKFRYEIGCRIKKVRGRLDSIKREISGLGLNRLIVYSGEREGMESEAGQREMRDRETSALLDERLIVGREYEKKLVVDLLLGSSREVKEVPLLVGESSGEVKEVPLLVGESSGEVKEVPLLVGESSGEVKEVPLLAGESIGEVREVPLLVGGSSGEVKEVPLLLGESSSGAVEVRLLPGGSSGGAKEVGLLLGGSSGGIKEVGLFLGGSSGNQVKEVRSGEVNVPLVISIVGMPGLGKTTLAQLTYNDEKVKGHFHMRMWVYVSQDFDVKRITESIIKSADTKFKGENLNLNELQTHLREMLRKKIFLLVLDDIWSEDSEKWDKLSTPFQAAALGSRILITTRSEEVASAMQSAHVYKPAVLSDEDCWLLFSSKAHKALEHQNAKERSALEKIGREIVNKCGGVPLAAKTIGSAMRSRRTRREWEDVLGSEIWNSSRFLGSILPALLLSYRDLSPVLKQCFSYFSIFPKGIKIEKDMMVKLWVAQGFIGSDTSSAMEEIGGLYFDDLLIRSLLQESEFNDDYIICKYKMHDLVHDLAQSVAGSDCSLVQIGKRASLNFNNLRHSSFVSAKTVNEADEVAYILATLYKSHKLRTLFLDSRISMVPRMSFHHWRRLRALNLSYTRIKKLSPTVGHLKHLRFLDLSCTYVEELPEEVCNCLNLQTLRLNYCGRLKKLPGGMKKMIYLRHLEFEDFDDLEYLPQGIGRLTRLRTVSKFIVGGGNEGCKCGELKHLNHLQGSLLITGLDKNRSRDEAREAELNKKQHLHTLSFTYKSEYDHELLDEEAKRMEDVLEILQPHTNLKELEIRNYRGSKLPKWIEDPVFSNLVKVKLCDCRECKLLPGLGKLPSLESLYISDMNEVRKVGVEFSGVDNNDGSGCVVSFPKLEKLVFSSLTNWEEWELRGRDGEVMPSLLRLVILDCPKLKEWELRGGDGEVMPSLLELQIFKCRKLKELPSNLPPLLQKLTLQISNEGMLSSGGTLPVLPNLKHLIIYERLVSSGVMLTSFPCGWLGQFKALEALEIKYFHELESLPDEELQQLTMLQVLKIFFCPLLAERYGDGGEDRDKIAQIPRISIL